MLSKLFEGVDVIGDSDAGRSFQAFWRLLNDAEQSAQLDAALEAVLARGFARKLDRNERAFLRGFTGTMLDRGGQVHDVLQHFARSLRGFVQSRGYLEQRRLNQLLKQAQSEALALRDEFSAQRPIGRDLQLTTSRLRSWSQWKLHDPRSAQVDGSVQRNDAASISLESVGDLVASSEIDFRTLRRDLHELLGALIGAALAWTLERFGFLDRWSRFRANWFFPDARGALVLLALWQFATGLSNVVLDWPLLAAVMHTGGAGALMMTLTWMLSRSRVSGH